MINFRYPNSSDVGRFCTTLSDWIRPNTDFIRAYPITSDFILWFHPTWTDFIPVYLTLLDLFWFYLTSSFFTRFYQTLLNYIQFHQTLFHFTRFHQTTVIILSLHDFTRLYLTLYDIIRLHSILYDLTRLYPILIRLYTILPDHTRQCLISADFMQMTQFEFHEIIAYWENWYSFFEESKFLKKCESSFRFFFLIPQILDSQERTQ